jgi:hypothetical protein
LLAASAPSASAAPTREQYIAQVDPICQSANAGIQRKTRGLGRDFKEERYDRAAKKFRKALPIFVRLVNDLDAIEPPAEHAEFLEDWVRSLRRQIPLVRRFAKALTGGKEGPIDKAGVKLAVASGNSMELVATYGFNQCDKA